MSLVKKLGPRDKRNWTGAAEVLRLWLMTQDKVNEEELKKVWEGFLCLANECPWQHALMENLTTVIGALNLNLARGYFQAFLMALRREWGGLGCFKLEMFNHLLGRILHHMHLLLDKNGWDSKYVNGFMGDMVQTNLLAANKPQRMNSYFADIYLNELHCFFPMQLDAFGHLIENSLRFKRLNRKQGQDVDNKEENLGSITLTNRKVLYELHREFSRLSQHLTLSGFKISFHGATIPKINVSAREFLEVNTFSIQALRGESAPPLNSQQNNSIESINQDSQWEDINLDSEMRSGKAQVVESTIKENSMWEFDANYKNGLAGDSEKKFSEEAEEIQDSADEVTLSHACSYQNSANDFNKEETLDIVYGNPDDVMMLDDPEDHFEEGVTELHNCASPIQVLAASVSPLNFGSNKRKSEQSPENGLDGSFCPAGCHESEGGIICSNLLGKGASADRSVQKRVKRVRFCLKNNIVWKPHNPLPPENLRVPPSATPRGSALKKGVPAGPICIIKKSPRKKPVIKQKSVVIRKSVRTMKSSSTSPMVLRKQRAISR